MHAEAMRFAVQMLSRIGVGSWILDGKTHRPELVVEIGSRNVNGSIRQRFDGLNVRYVGVDIEPGPGVDVVADGATYSPPRPPSMVVCMEVLEHTPQGAEIVGNAARALAPGGWLLVTCATNPRSPHSAADGGQLREGEFYANIPAADLHAWVDQAGLTIAAEEVHADRGDLYVLAGKP